MVYKYSEYKRLWQAKWREKNPEKQKLRSQRYLENRKKKYPFTYTKILAESVRNWRLKYPHKVKAHRKVFSALRNGTLQKGNCEVCRSERVEAHHEDYNHPLQIIWLCRKHHIIADRKRRKDDYPQV